jgi:sulfur oxidation c-type cytochrome SoxX
MQANCAQCHTDEGFAGTPLVAQGRQLFFSRNCYGCHKIEGLSEGTLAPDLTEAGKKYKVDYLWESIVDPTANLAASFMPKFNLTDGEVKALTVFLKSRRGMNFSETSLERYRATLSVRKPDGSDESDPQLTGPAQLAHGQQVIRDRACAACHKLGDTDGRIAPDLSYEGLLRDEPWVYEHFKNPRSRVPDSIMPSFRFVDGDFRAMSLYLTSLKTPPPPMSPADTYKALCLRCHGEKGDGHGAIAWYLDPYPRDLTKAGFINSKSLDRLTNSVAKGVAGTSMPAWGNALKSEQVRDVLQYVFTTFTKEPRRELKPVNVPVRIRSHSPPLPPAMANASSSSVAPAAMAARPTAKAPTRSTSCPALAICATRRSWIALATGAFSNPYSTEYRVPPCLPGSITGYRKTMSAT